MVDDAGARYPLTIDPLTGSPASPDFTATGEAPSSQFGWSVAGAGDVNGDGYADIMVSTSGLHSTDTGRAYIYHGGPGGLQRQPRLHRHPARGQNNFFGSALAPGRGM